MDSQEKCFLDVTKSNWICTDKKVITLRMDRKEKLNFVKRLQDTISYYPEEERNVVQQEIDKIKKNPSILDLSFPIETIKLIGNFANNGDNIFAMQIDDAFVKEQGLVNKFTALNMNKKDIKKLKEILPKNISFTDSIQEFADSINK